MTSQLEETYNNSIIDYWNVDDNEYFCIRWLSERNTEARADFALTARFELASQTVTTEREP